MAKHTQQRLFGGSWTQEKLERLAKYLHAYTTIFKANPRASFFETTYVDAFAGTGTLVAPTLPLGRILPELVEGVEDYQKGSVRRALEVEPQFNHYIFIEKDKKRFLELKSIREEFPDRDIQVRNEDANEFLRTWCHKLDTRQSRAVVFLDPFGTNVNWNVISLMGQTRAVDLWLLFPLFAVNRMLIKDHKPPDAWAKRLTEIFGTPGWEAEFYTDNMSQFRLEGFESVEVIAKVADTQRISDFLTKRLRAEFAAAAEPLVLYNSRNSPLYLFCFAAANEKGATTGLKIAKHILGQ
jgi:three-Cys-motif partner protein